MQEANEICNALILDFTENYMEKIFYFCLKKTDNKVEAEDLTQDIALQIIMALNKGVIPNKFSAWVWQIVRNRYSIWAKEKHSHNEAVTGSDIGEYEVEDENKEVLEEMIYAEQMALLQRELAFIKSDYRNIVVAYYIENKRVCDIASSLGLSISAVWQRLHRARLILKEGMNMAREFGKLSYKPENISFIYNGCSGKDGEPWNYISRSLCKNSLLAAYKTPATAEQLSMEIGVSLPYMEEELSALVDATLMKKNGTRYEPNFFIVSAKAQEKIYAHLRAITLEFTKVVIAAMEYDIKWRNQNCPEWHAGYQTLEDMKWALLMMETDIITSYTLQPFAKNASDSLNVGSWGYTLRPNGGEWDILGMESYYGDKPGFVGLTGCVSSPNEKELPEICFRQFKFQYSELEKRTPSALTYTEGQGLVAVASGKSNEVDEVILKQLESYGYIKKVEAGYVMTILVMQKDKLKKMLTEAQEQLNALRDKARDIATQHYLFCREQIYNEIPEFLKEDEFQINHACANMFTMRGAVLEEAIRQGYLLLNKENDKQMLGAYLVV